MPRRMILTDADRQSVLALPIDETTLIRHWTLDERDRRLLRTRRRDDTKLGLALQLCALRYPGRLIRRGEVVPEASLAFLADHLGADPQALADFARRAPTRYEQLAILRRHDGFTELAHSLRADLLDFARGVAIAATRDRHVVAALAEEMRRRRIVIPGITVLERLAAQACTQAEEALFTDVAGRLTPDLIVRMEALLGLGPRHARQSGVSWPREPPAKAGARAMRGLIDRLEAVRHVGVGRDMLQVVPPHRVRRMAQEGRRLTAQNFEQMRPGRRHATLAASLLEVEAELTDAAIAMFETLVARSFRQAEAARDREILETASAAVGVMAFFSRLGAGMVARQGAGLSLDEAVGGITSWGELAEATSAVRSIERLRENDDLIGWLRPQHGRIRAFAVPFLAAFRFESTRQSAGLVEAISLLRTAHRDRRTAAIRTWTAAALRLADRRWRRQALGEGDEPDARMLEIFLLVELKNRIAAGEVWVRGSRAYRALDEHMIPQATFDLIKAQARWAWSAKPIITVAFLIGDTRVSPQPDELGASMTIR